MASGSINEQPGLFGPESAIWRVNREAAVTLGGSCAILMQLAHPKVAAGVRDHSRYEVDLVGRLRRTLDLTMAMVFGSRAAALQAVRTINTRHRAVRGPGYSAMDPDLLIWVQATLVFAAVRAYRALVGPLTAADADRYYQDTKELGVLLGIPREAHPAGLPELDAFVKSMIDRGEVNVQDDARRMGWIVLQPRFSGVPRMAFAPLRTITAGLLPARLREQYGLRWGRPDRAMFGVSQTLVPRLLAVTPPRVRFLPPALRAYRQLRVQAA